MRKEQKGNLRGRRGGHGAARGGHGRRCWASPTSGARRCRWTLTTVRGAKWPPVPRICNFLFRINLNLKLGFPFSQLGVSLHPSFLGFQLNKTGRVLFGYEIWLYVFLLSSNIVVDASPFASSFRLRFVQRGNQTDLNWRTTLNHRISVINTILVSENNSEIVVCLDSGIPQ